MDDLAHNLLGLLKKPSAPADTKLNLFNNLKSNIKHQRIPESAQASTVECVRLAISSQTSSTLVTTGFSTLSHLIKRLTIQDQVNAIFSPRINILGALIDRLGDAKESYRSASFQCLCDLWPTRPGDVEKVIRENAIASSNVRAKEAGVQWVVKMHTDHQLQFKSFVPPLVDCLDHADGVVREKAKLGLIDLFRNASDRAKADLKRQLIAHGVRKSIASHILAELHVPVPSEISSGSTSSQAPARSETPYLETKPDSDPVLPPSQETSHIEPLYISSQRELDETFRTMQPVFEGRESEANWMARDNSILKLRRYLKGNAVTEHQAAFVGHIRHMLDGILKVANSLRTTMSTNGCHLVQELARTLGPSIDAMVELLMQNMLKLCSATKNIAAQNGNTSVDVLLSHVSYNVRLLQHVWNAVQDKNVQPRQFAAGWLKTLIRRLTHNKGQFEHSGGLELLEKCINKGLADANPKVRETMRGTFWAFAEVWSDRGDIIMNNLDTKSRQLLEKDPGNPNAGKSAFTASVGPGSSKNVREAVSNSRTNLKDTIAAQKKAALAAKQMPSRPNSAMADLSPMKNSTQSRMKSPALAGSTGARRHQPSTSQTSSSRPPAKHNGSSGHGSLMSGPVRRPKRPDLPRPATADPYANQRMIREGSPPSRGSDHSPGRSASKSFSTLHKKPAPSSSGRPGTSGTDKSSQAATPHISPSKSRPRTIHGMDAVPTGTPGFNPAHNAKSPSPSGDSIMVPASAKKNSDRARATPRQNLSRENRPASRDYSGPRHSPMASMSEEDNFTLVMPPQLGNKPHGLPSRKDDPASMANGSNFVSQPRSDLEEPPAPSQGQDMNVIEAKPDVEVHEDASASYESINEKQEPPGDVLQELPNQPNQQQPTDHSDDGAQNGDNDEDIRSASPTKKGISMTVDGANQDRAEVMKNRRILSSGIERLKAKTLDAHGFRRLQDIVRIPAHDSAAQMSALLQALIGYIESPHEALKVSNTKATSLKSQALATMRGIVVLHKTSIEVRQHFLQAICATLVARQMVEAAPHFATDLEKTAFELVKSAEDQTVDCLDGVLDFVSRESASGAPAQHRMTTMALSVLAKFQGTLRTRSIELNGIQKQQLGKLIVRFLDDNDPDVRRADTELCIELFEHFGEERKEEFWSLLTGAREAQLNLVAYYLARRVHKAR